MIPKEYGRNTLVGCGILAAFGTYMVATGGPVATYADPNALIKWIIGGNAIMLAYVMFGIRRAIARVLKRLGEW